MTKYDDRDDDKDNDRNKDINDDENSAAGSGSDGPIFNLQSDYDTSAIPRSRGGLLGDNGNVSAAPTHYVSTCWTIYLSLKKTILNMYHKLLYAKIGILDLFC